jgi:putative glutamine amidotransferase
MKKNINKPIIGLSPNYISYAISESLGAQKLFINEDYIHAITQAGGVPLILPIAIDSATVIAYVTLIDGLLLSGGDDITPLLYGEEPSPKLMTTRPERDQFEIALIKETLKQKKPILGICRGLQILNVALGGTLYQDIPSEVPEKLVQHRQQSKEHVATHSVDLSAGSKMKAIMKSDTLITNSFHHQSIKNLAPGLEVVAKARDGIIEGIEMPDAKFVLAVQWHPECMVKSDSQMLKLFIHFVEAASTKEICS